MTHDEQISVGGEPAWHRAIDALLDGEAVEREALRLALDEAPARDYFVDAMMIRQLTRDMGPAHFVASKRPGGSIARSVRWLAAVLILSVGAGVGYGYGQRLQQPAAPGSVEVVLDQAPAPPAPEPTRHIRFEPGVNWTSESRSK